MMRTINGKKAEGDFLYSLITLEEFKSLMGIDDREDKIARFCLVTGTHTIEQYCKRRFLRKKHLEYIEYFGDLILPLREYPICKILAVYLLGSREKKMNNEKLRMNNEENLDPTWFRVVPDCDSNMNFPYAIELSSVVKKQRGLKYIKVVYTAGYAANKVPADLAAACMELAAWNMNRYRGRRIGITGNIRGTGKDGEHFEMSMPENVRALLEPYKRRTI